MKLSKRLLALCVAAVLIFSLTGVPHAFAADSTDANVVYTMDDLIAKISVNEDVTLGCDIKVTSWSNKSYTGIFDGNGYTLDCVDLGTRTNAMFPTLSGTVKNVTIKGLTFSSTTNEARGPLTNNNKGTISNVHLVDVSASTNQDKAIGAITAINYGTIEYCTVNGSVNGTNHVGGIAGTTDTAGSSNYITKCVNYADVTASGGRVGGIVGTLRAGGVVSYCVNYGTIQSTNTGTKKLVGGIATTNVAWDSAIASHCLNAGTLQSSDMVYVGGIVGTDKTLASPAGSKCYTLVAGGSGNTNYNGEVIDSMSAALVDNDHLTNVFTYTEGAAYPIALAHTHDVEAVAEDAASCTEDGHIAYWRCTVCGKYYSDAACTTEITQADTVKPAVHNWEDATCTTPKACSVCFETEGEALGHTMTHQAAAKATCVKDGNLEYWYCSVCEKYFKNEAGTEEYGENGWVVASEGHQWDNGTPKTCTVCFTTSCVESGHTLTHQAAADATCVKDGNLEYWYCSGCGKYFKDEACEQEYADGEWITSVPHSATKTGAQDATCTQDGNLDYWYCDSCKKYYKDEACTQEYVENGWIVSGGHSAVKTDAKSATCAEPGNLDYWYCSVCETHFKDEACTETYAEGAWIVTVDHDLTKTDGLEPTEAADGNIAYWTCTSCGKHFADESAEKELAENGWILYATPVTGKGNAGEGVCNEALTGAGAISSEADLLNMIKAISNDKDGIGLTGGYWYLTQDITVSSWSQIPYFNGTLDGNGFTISFADGLTVDNALIKKTGANAVIKDLTISGLTMEASGEKMAAIINENNGILYCVSVEDLAVTTSNSNIAGVVYVNKGTIADLLVDGISVKGIKDVGGICQENKGLISDVTVLNAGITGTGDRAAVIACINNGGTVQYCVAYGQVTSKFHVAGIVARGNGTVKNCINYADVTATNSRAAGIVASAMEGCTITNCGNYGKIESQTNGGKTAGVANLLSADAVDVTVTNCFNAGKIVVNSTAAVGVGTILGNAVVDAAVTNCYAVENSIFCSDDNSQYADSAVKDAVNGTLITAEVFADSSMAGKLNGKTFLYLSESDRSVALSANPNPVADPSPETGDTFLSLSLVLLLCSGTALAVCGKKRFSL